MKDINEVVERGFADILDCMNSGVYVTDTERRIVYWNKGAQEITGFTAEEVQGRPCADDILRHRDKDGRVLCTSDLCPLHRSMVRAAPSEAPILVYAYSKDGENLALLTSTAPVFDEDGNVIGGVEIFRDERESLRQMQLARVVQQQMLTLELPDDPRVAFAVQYAPHGLVSGDFYHVRQLSPDLFAMFLADAAGHGVSAALSCALVYSLLKECEDRLADPAALMSAINDRAAQRASGHGFFTAVAATVDARRRVLTFCSAGHPPLLLHRADSGQVERLATPSLPAGLQPGGEYEGEAVELAAGDRVLAYSDGATDVVVDAEGRRLGIEGLAGLLAAQPGPDLDMARLYEELLDRCRTIEPEDDVTLLGCAIR